MAEKFISTHEKLMILSNRREEYIKKRENSWNEEKKDYDYNPEEAMDYLAEGIMAMIKENLTSLSFDTIFEELAKLGDCPNLIYDDDGHWSIPSASFGSAITEGPWDNTVSFFVKKKDWFDTPREALENYIFHE